MRSLLPPDFEKLPFEIVLPYVPAASATFPVTPRSVHPVGHDGGVQDDVVAAWLPVHAHRVVSIW